jgi:hypothetical protein
MLLLFVALISCTCALNFSGSLTVSGISAGGFMASQMHVAFSSQIQGAGIFAGGPFYCAQDTIVGALTACTVDPFLLDVGILVSEAKNYANKGNIDPLSNLNKSRVFLVVFVVFFSILICIYILMSLSFPAVLTRSCIKMS